MRFVSSDCTPLTCCSRLGFCCVCVCVECLWLTVPTYILPMRSAQHRSSCCRHSPTQRQDLRPLTYVTLRILYRSGDSYFVQVHCRIYSVLLAHCCPQRAVRRPPMSLTDFTSIRSRSSPLISTSAGAGGGGSGSLSPRSPFGSNALSASARLAYTPPSQPLPHLFAVRMLKAIEEQETNRMSASLQIQPSSQQQQQQQQQLSRSAEALAFAASDDVRSVASDRPLQQQQQQQQHGSPHQKPQGRGDASRAHPQPSFESASTIGAPTAAAAGADSSTQRHADDNSLLEAITGHLHNVTRLADPHHHASFMDAPSGGASGDASFEVGLGDRTWFDGAQDSTIDGTGGGGGGGGGGRVM